MFTIGELCMKIVIDCYGADYSPDELVKGAINSVNLIEDLELILTGKQDEIQKIIDENGYISACKGTTLLANMQFFNKKTAFSYKKFAQFKKR